MILRCLRAKNVHRKRVDSLRIPGYQGIADIHPNADFPYKAGKNKPLDHEEKEYNTALSRLRVKVDHIINEQSVPAEYETTYAAGLILLQHTYDCDM